MVDVVRHARHIALPEVGMEGQRRLQASSVLIIGAGGSTRLGPDNVHAEYCVSQTTGAQHDAAEAAAPS